MVAQSSHTRVMLDPEWAVVSGLVGALVVVRAVVDVCFAEGDAGALGARVDLGEDLQFHFR